MRRESGDQRGRSLSSPSCVICRGAPPSSGTIQICVGFLFAATSTVCTEKATQRPSGEICGSAMRFSAIMALASKGRFCAKSAPRRRVGERAGGAYIAIVAPVEARLLDSVGRCVAYAFQSPMQNRGGACLFPLAVFHGDSPNLDRVLFR